MKKLLILIIVFTLITALSACEIDKPGLTGDSKTYTSYFETSVSVTLYYHEETSGDTLKEIFNGVETRLENIHQIATRHESYEGVTNIHTINNQPGRMHEVDPELFELIEMGIDYHELTDGYFDITLGPVLDLWDERMDACNHEGDCALPERSALKDANESVGIEGITMDEENHRVSIEEGMLLDLGAIGKGYATDIIDEYLKRFDIIDSFMINAGTSSVKVSGEHPVRESGRWVISTNDPQNPPENCTPFNMEDCSLARLQIKGGTSLATSGDYARYFTYKGNRYHHLINPNTQYPSNYYSSVTLTVEDGALGDTLSTAVFLMPPEKSEAFVADLDNVEALWVYPDGGLKLSEGFDDYVLEWLNN